MSREDSNKILNAKDGMDIILNAMTTHVDRTDVQESGCDLLWSLAFNSSAVKDIIAKHSGATVLVRALKRHSRSADFLKSACGALSNMCQSKLNQEGVSSQGGLQPLVSSIHVHQTSAKLLPFIFDAIASIIVNNEENGRTVSSLGIIPVVVASLSRHKSCMEVVKSGCHTLAILSDVKGQASKIAFAGGVPIILALLDAHPLYSDLHRVAAVVLLRMLQESAHVGREITCHEGVRILLNSLEKGGAQQDTVAAVTHILYTVTNPSSPASSMIESQLWIYNKSSVVTSGFGGDGDDVTVTTSSSDMRNGGKSSTAIMTLSGGPGVPAINRRQSHVCENLSPLGATGGLQGQGASALGGIVLILGQYTVRRDVVRAACRLVNNLSGYANVVQALDRLQILDRMLECVSVHRDTKDVLDSACSLIKAIHRKTIPVLSATTTLSMHGFLHIMRTKTVDEDFMIACTDICTRVLETSSRLSNDRRRELDECRCFEGKVWESHALGVCMSLLENLVESEKESDSGGTASSSLVKTQSFSKATWSKNSLRLIVSILTFVESIYVNTRLGVESIMCKDMFDCLWGLLRVLPPKHADLVNRLEKILNLIDSKSRKGEKTLGGKNNPIARASSPLDNGVIPVGSNKTRSIARLPSDDLMSDTATVGVCVSSPVVGIRGSVTSVSAPSTAGSVAVRGSVGGSNLPMSDTSGASSWELRSERSNESNVALDTHFIEYYANSNMMIPQHPLKAVNSIDAKKLSSVGISSLLNCWPNHLERLNLSGNLSTGLSTLGIKSSFINQSDTELSSSCRMHMCYESRSAAGKGLLSKCPIPVPYLVPPNGQGDPFLHSLTFDSEFESGNLLRAVQKGDATYDLFLRSDLHTQGHTQWFYFAVANTHPADLVRLHEQGVQVPPMRVRFNIVNLTKPDSLFNLGMRPVVYSCQDATSKGAGWIRSGSDISYYSNSFMRNNTAGEGLSCYYTLSFTIEFGNPKDTVLIAYSYPFTMGDYRHNIRQILDKPKSADIIRQTRLCQTLGGDDCDLLVITNFKDKDRDRIGPVSVAMLESRVDNLAGGSSSLSLSKSTNNNNNNRESKSTFSGRQTLKPSLFLSARVHPGETPASWMMKGMLDFLTSDCSQAKLLRQVYVIFIVPMLNPDGVTYGNNRCSLAGVDLNRQWKLPLKTLQPTIFYLKSFMAAQRKIRDVNMYIDLHGHSRKYNVFMYGCDDKKRPKPQVRAFPKFFSMHNIGRKYVCFADCSFHVKKGRESTARVVVAKDLNIPCSFTLEATFCGSNYGPLKHCHMNIGHMQEVGAALCDAILNFSISEGQVKDTMMVPANLKAVAQVERAMAAESVGQQSSHRSFSESSVASGELNDIGSYFKNSSTTGFGSDGPDRSVNVNKDGVAQDEVMTEEVGPDRGDVSSGSDEGSICGVEVEIGSESEGSTKGGNDGVMNSGWRACRSSTSTTSNSVFGKGGSRDLNESPRSSMSHAAGIAMPADVLMVGAKISTLKLDKCDGREIVAPFSDRVTMIDGSFSSAFEALESTSEPVLSEMDRHEELSSKVKRAITKKKKPVQYQQSSMLTNTKSSSFSMSDRQHHNSLSTRTSRTDLTCPDVSSTLTTNGDTVSGVLFNRSSGSIVRSNYSEMVVGSGDGPDCEDVLETLAKTQAVATTFGLPKVNLTK